MERVYFYVLTWWLFLVIVSWDDDFAEYIGQFGAEVAKGFASGSVP